MKLVIFIIAILVVAATLLPLSRSDVWWIRIWDFPRLQVAIAAAVVVGTMPFIGLDLAPVDITVGGLLLISLAYQSYMMFPYTRLARHQVQRSRGQKDDKSEVSFVFANVLMTNRKAQGLLKIIEDADPDIVLAVETDHWWVEALRPLEEDRTYRVLQPQENTYGMALYSRLELIGAKVHFLVQNDIPSIHATVRLPSGIEFELRCLHPRPPFPTEDDSAEDRDAELLIVGRERKIRQSPAVVIGDLNDVAWSRTNYLFQNFSGLLDPRIGRGFFHTFHADYPFLRIPLDHCFHSRHFRLVDFRRLAYFGSDHFPVFISLRYEADAELEHDKLSPTSSEAAEANEKIEEASTQRSRLDELILDDYA
ncbi:MAG: endonuclease/exonuclease/phosphatase family protein [Acidobacteria bacterium]|nr:endonuclease/exonuclease/phosphatase family protein [Acidobacteriota bacterium]MCA1608246.1 endonuclease/exonuclease/phosphatase family protein [Acidobacteriota bacterium]